MDDYLISSELGVLPYPGAFQEQPHSVVLMYRILRGAAAQAQSEEMKKAESK